MFLLARGHAPDSSSMYGQGGIAAAVGTAVYAEVRILDRLALRAPGNRFVPGNREAACRCMNLDHAGGGPRLAP